MLWRPYFASLSKLVSKVLLDIKLKDDAVLKLLDLNFITRLMIFFRIQLDQIFREGRFWSIINRLER